MKKFFTGKKLIIGAALMSLIIAMLASATGVGAINTNVLILHGSTTLGPTMVAAAPYFNTYEQQNPGSQNYPQIDISSIVQNGSSNGINDLRNSATGVVASIAVTNGGSGYISANRFNHCSWW